MFENKQLIFFSDKNSKYCTVIELSVVCIHTEIPQKSGPESTLVTICIDGVRVDYFYHTHKIRNQNTAAKFEKN